MKIIMLALFGSFFYFLPAQTVKVSYECRNFFSTNFLSKIDQLPQAKKTELINKFDGLVKHYSVISDGNQNIRTLDSITQKCNLEHVSMYSYQQILIYNATGWAKYLKLNESLDSEVYKINEPKSQQVWKVDYNSTKNILGFKCFFAYNESNEKEWAWFTLDVPITVTPVSKFPFKGIVLEFQDESDVYLSTELQINEEMVEIECFDVNDKIKNLNSFKEFSDILIKQGVELSSHMFQCRKL